MGHFSLRFIPNLCFLDQLNYFPLSSSPPSLPGPHCSIFPSPLASSLPSFHLINIFYALTCYQIYNSNKDNQSSSLCGAYITFPQWKKSFNFCKKYCACEEGWESQRIFTICVWWSSTKAPQYSDLFPDTEYVSLKSLTCKKYIQITTCFGTFGTPL